ncbi:respiratory nitrate reductase subunit gamma [Microbulbifer agarilyticus]|uniref:nitrate reductase (quinone) n=1 Tax=Microbulbifer agarilyticus TaxID=260552 RepID=A0A1Q2M305_9GAMM|nr:respiratory nitrate reductase subunit gamma [Microbulbifer agarilyticus]AQQ67060.1 respiratory nitrate reductase subunit gamma [Microbulbifer agarilyticus]
MHDFINYLLFGWYPYVALTIMILGSIIRFDKGQYGWRSQSSQFLRRKQMMWGSNLFHLGILVLLFGHFVGLLTPIGVFDALGISHSFKQWMALSVGGIAGILGFIGCTLLLHRRLYYPRIRKSSSKGDILVLLFLWLQLLLGIATIFWTIDHMDGSAMVLFMGWAQGVITFNPDAANLIIDAHLVYKLHIILGLTLLAITPFTRLVHVFSAPFAYVLRPGYQIVRSRRLARRTNTPPPSSAPSSVPSRES